MYSWAGRAGRGRQHRSRDWEPRRRVQHRQLRRLSNPLTGGAQHSRLAEEGGEGGSSFRVRQTEPRGKTQAAEEGVLQRRWGRSGRPPSSMHRRGRGGDSPAAPPEHPSPSSALLHKNSWDGLRLAPHKFRVALGVVRAVGGAAVGAGDGGRGPAELRGWRLARLATAALGCARQVAQRGQRSPFNVFLPQRREGLAAGVYRAGERRRRRWSSASASAGCAWRARRTWTRAARRSGRNARGPCCSRRRARRGSTWRSWASGA